VLPMGNYVIAGVGNYVIANSSNLGNYVIADSQPSNHIGSLYAYQGGTTSTVCCERVERR